MNTENYGLVWYNNGWRKSQRFFDEYKVHDTGVDVKLLKGKWIAVKEKAVIRYPKKEETKP